MILFSLIVTGWIVLCSGQRSDYCDITQDHAMCKTGTYAGECENYSSYEERPPNQDEINTILRIHNEARQKAASGNEDRAINGPLPVTDCMLQLKWNNNLAITAQGWTNHCIYRHNCADCRMPLNDEFTYVGQNIVMASYSGNKTLGIDYSWLVDLWYSPEVVQYDRNDLCNYQSGPWGHYTQMIWGNTRYIGCGATIFKDNDNTYHYVACNYGEGGNYIGQCVYSTQCSSCPPETSPSSDYSDLCD